MTWSLPGALSWPCEIGPLGYKFMTLWTVYEMACFFVTLDGNVPVIMHYIQVPAVRSHDSGCASPSVH